MIPKTYEELRQNRFDAILKKREIELNKCLSIIKRNNSNIKRNNSNFR